jgi:hypothetical protein
MSWNGRGVRFLAFPLDLLRNLGSGIYSDLASMALLYLFEQQFFAGVGGGVFQMI